MTAFRSEWLNWKPSKSEVAKGESVPKKESGTSGTDSVEGIPENFGGGIETKVGEFKCSSSNIPTLSLLDFPTITNTGRAKSATSPKTVVPAARNEVVGRFLAEHALVQPPNCRNPLTYMVQSNILYREFRDWCHMQEVVAMTKERFEECVQSALFISKLHRAVPKFGEAVDEWTGFRYVSGGLTKKEQETNEQTRKVHDTNEASDLEYRAKLEDFQAAIRQVEPVKFWSKVLNEHFYLVADEAVQKHFQEKVPGEAVYTCAEILELIQKPQDEILQIHKAKVLFGATIQRTC
jgi:hypothetical protein